MRSELRLAKATKEIVLVRNTEFIVVEVPFLCGCQGCCGQGSMNQEWLFEALCTEEVNKQQVDQQAQAATEQNAGRVQQKAAAATVLQAWWRRLRRRRQLCEGSRRAKPSKPVIGPALGGHDFKPTDGMIRRGWQCALCHCTTDRPARLTHQHCAGSAVRRWAAQTAALAGRTSGVGESYVLLLTGIVVWSFQYGASASVRASNLL